MASKAATAADIPASAGNILHEQYLKYLIDALPHRAWLADTSGAVLYINRVWQDYGGLSFANDSSYGEFWSDALHPADKDIFCSWYREALKGVRISRPEVRLMNASSETKYSWFLLDVAPVRDTEGAPAVWLGTCTNISRQKQAIADLKDIKERYQTLFNSNMIGIMISGLGSEETILEANDEFLRLIGYTREEVEQKSVTWSDITPPEYNRGDEEKVAEIFREGSVAPFEKEYIRKDGSRIPVLVGAARMDPSSAKSVNFALDISAQKRVERRKDEFMGMASHELKTPLSVQKLYIHMLTKEVVTKGFDSLAPIVEKIDRQTEKLDNIVGDMLDIARIEAGKIVLREADFSVSELVNEIVEESKLLHHKKNIVAEQQEDLVLHGDRERIVQVFTNLISNAAKYSPLNKPITLTCSSEEGYARFCVRDEGIGISPENQEKIFSRFYRVDGTNEQTYPGMGVGLFIASDIIKRHGGTIAVKSEEGRGSTFCFTVPLAESKN